MTLGDLKGTLEYFFHEMFGPKTDVRFRPHFFPFTEPSAEMDVKYTKKGETIEIGAGDSWMEILGSGMVHPNVLRNCGIDVIERVPVVIPANAHSERYLSVKRIKLGHLL